ncbi:MAG: carboxypeptidase-like regulatory domain-containing protein [Muribaculaceae bacterium]|nr:carboxypeptidase-like regulatory domain-containing protein [Muribaculaceae bacterium]
MRYSILILLMLISCLSSQAAKSVYILSGKVTDGLGEPISFATIALEHTKFAAAVNIEGDYVLKVPQGIYTGKVTAVGFKPYNFKIKISKDTVLNIRLDEDVVVLQDVSVYGKTTAKKLEEGAFSVNAVEITPNVNKMVTLNDLVDRTAGVKVRREGGMGSEFDLTINGMSGNSIRYFIDGVPLETKGSGLTLDNVPINTVERVELYKGVVPSYLSSDALGGAVNIVTKRKRQNFLDASYAIGSFHTHSGDITGQYIIPGTVIAIHPTFSINYSKNDYKMRGVEVWSEEEDKYIFTDKRRFHDDYLSLFGQIEAGVSDVKWTDRFFVGVSYNKLDKQIQTGAMQNKVYGEASRHSHSFGVSARYNKRWGKWAARAILSHTRDYSETVDTAYRKYSWDGTWMPSTGNELNNKRRTLRVYKRPLTVVNAGVDYELNDHHTFALNYMLNRRGNDRWDKVDNQFEPSNDIVTKHILSFTYAQTLFDQRWQTSYFVKDYINALSIEQRDDFTITGSDQIDTKSSKSYWGAGIGSRYSVAESFSVKASYEHSVRLPLSRELLGNGTTVYANLALSPETSNNYNLGLFGTWLIDDENQINYEANGFIRHVQNYIRATVSEREGMMQYVNEPAIDIKGCDFDISYFWNNRLNISLNGSWSDARDLKKYKTDGNPSATYKNRVPNRPWMFGNAEASYTFHDLIATADRLRVGVAYQYIHWYYLNWEAFGAIASKARIPTQNITNVSITYSWKKERYNLSLECNNLFDCLAYDNYMLQKPGRAFSVKFRIFIN